MEIDYYRGPMYCFVSYNYKTTEYLCIEKYKICAILGAVYLFILVCLIIDVLKCFRRFCKMVMS